MMKYYIDAKDNIATHTVGVNVCTCNYTVITNYFTQWLLVITAVL